MQSILVLGAGLSFESSTGEPSADQDSVKPGTSLSSFEPPMILEEKLKLDLGYKDMIVMQHQIDIFQDGEYLKRYATMVYIGQNRHQTAMSDTVGLPLALTARLILEGKYREPGVQLPIHPEIYNQVLEELESFGILFTEEEIRTPQRNQDQTVRNRT